MRSRSVLSRNLKARRAELGISQEELAYRAGVDRSYVTGVEGRKYSVGLDKLDQFAVALGLPPEALISDHRS